MTIPLPPEREGSSRQSRPGEGLSSPDKAYDPTPTERSRHLRNNATPAERKLWGVISSRRLNRVRFNRQVVIKPYICDFVARSAKLVIELDGGQHSDALAYDQARSKYLEARGYRVLRFWNNDVMHNIDGVVRQIEEALNQPPPARAGGVDSPNASEGGPVPSPEDRPSPSALRASSPPALAGWGKIGE